MTTTTTTTTTTTPATTESLNEHTLRLAVRAGVQSDQSNYAATVSLAAFMAAKQIAKLDAGEALDEKRMAEHWRAYLKRLVYVGNVVWRDQDHEPARIQGLKPAERAKAASDHIDKKDKAWRMVDGLATRKTFVFRMVKDILANHAGMVRDMVALRDAGADCAAIMERWSAAIAEHYGETYAALTTRLRNPAPPKPEEDPVDVIMKKVADLNLTQIRALYDRVKALRDEKASDDADMGGMHVEMTSPPVLKEVAYTTRNTGAKLLAAGREVTQEVA